LIVANIGDSRAIVCRKDSKVVFSSKDHKLERSDELERISCLKGVVVEKPLGVKRITPSREEFSEEVISKRRYALNMSRSLGHVILARYGVSADPEFDSVEIENGDILILASDGLWEVMENLEVAQFLNNYFAIPSDLLDPFQICKDIYKEVAQRSKIMGRKEDNTTIVIVQFSSNQ